MFDLDKLELTEISSLHAELLLECEEFEPVSSVQSAPSTPVAARQGTLDLFRSRSLHSSPTNLGSGVRTSSVKDLVNKFEISKSLNMAEVKAKSESAFSLGKIDYAKRWVTRILNSLQTALLAGGDKLDLNEFNKHNAQVQDQCDLIKTLSGLRTSFSILVLFSVDFF